MKASRQQIRQLNRDNRGWPEHLIDVPPPWPSIGLGAPGQSLPIRVMRSRKFFVSIWDQEGTIRLSVMRTTFDERTGKQLDGISWDDLQRLKGEAGYADATAVEIYPPAGRVINVSNMRHLFFTEAPGFMW